MPKRKKNHVNPRRQLRSFFMFHAAHDALKVVAKEKGVPMTDVLHATILALAETKCSKRLATRLSRHIAEANAT